MLLILAGVAISMLSGDNGILNKAVQAKDATRGGEVQETVALEAANNVGAEYLGGTKKTRPQVISELHANGKLTDAEVATLEENDVITIGGIIEALEPGANTQFNSSMTLDYSNVYDFKITLK